ncbi:hypothetical protein H920_17648 [Fukomys damarensis]|uniref:Uncharacterized protein n=1 Tax=Fukomys damarensis TaxID=885580 RepID=A0A091CTG8_FUKDA|nr:hypothetical protein H920_17648 [Fukomys damarensis]
MVEIKISQHVKYTCSFRGKTKMESGCRDQALRVLHENSGWWCLDLQHHFCHCSQVGHQKTEGTERPVEEAL